MTMTPHKYYGLAALAVFAVEAAIALFVRDRLVRPLVGDALAVILVYLDLRAATGWRRGAAIAVALGVAFAIELGQLLGLVDLLRLRDDPVARIVLGAQFDPWDLLAHCVGAACIAAVEGLATKPNAATA